MPVTIAAVTSPSIYSLSRSVSLSSPATGFPSASVTFAVKYTTVPTAAVLPGAGVYASPPVVVTLSSLVTVAV